MGKVSRTQVNKDILDMPNKHLLLELPTSFGKSRIAINILAKRNITPDKRILIVIPRLVLIDNWKDEFRKWNKPDYVDNVVFVTYVSFPKMAGYWDMVIFDECHHLSLRCQEALEGYTINNSILLSATVKRDMRWTLGLLFPGLGKYMVRIKDATEEGVLPDPRVYLFPLKLGNVIQDQIIVKNASKPNSIIIEYKDRWKFVAIKDRKIHIRCTQQQYYNDLSSLIEWYKRRTINPFMKNLYLQKCGERLKWLSTLKTGFIHTLKDYFRKERTLIFCNSINQTVQLGKYCINSDNKLSEEYLDKFNKGKINHITACNMLDEGINLVNCRIGIYATLNSSERMIKQKLGRLLRHPDPIIIIPYYENTRDEEIVNKMCEDYNPALITKVSDINKLINSINGKQTDN